MAQVDAPTVGGLHQLRNTYQAHTRLFMIVILICLLSVFGWLVTIPIVTTLPWTRNSMLLAGGLLVVHFALHWLSQYIGKHRYRVVGYLLAQSILLLALSQVFHYPGVILFEYGPLLGEVVGLFELPWLVAVVVTVQMYSLYTLGLGLNFMEIPGLTTLGSTVLRALTTATAGGVAVSLLGTLPYLIALILQVQSRHEASELVGKLDAAHQQLKTYAQQVEDLTLAAERERMARELHDTLAQGVAGIILQLEALEISQERGDVVRAAQVTSQIKVHARDVLASSRRAIDDLRTLSAQPGALVSALSQEFERFSALTGIPVSVDVLPSLTLPAALSEHVLRCVTEGLTNVARHAHASRVDVTIDRRDHQIFIEVRDDGVGFNAASASRPSGHYGLIGLRERARLMGGSVEVDSRVGAGTSLRIHLPVELQQGAAV